MPKADIAVCMHAFYIDVLRETLPYLNNIPVEYDLFVTCSEEVRLEVVNLLAGVRANAEIVCVENLGMDVLPFLYLGKVFRLELYKAVLKIHTKNNKTTLGKAHGALFRRTLLGSREIVSSVLEAFESDNELTMIGPNDLYRSAQYMMYNNRDAVKQICKLIGRNTHVANWGFFAGTMFWIRGRSLSRLITHYSDFYELARGQGSGKEKTGRDGSLAHAMERIWGALHEGDDQRVGLVYQCETESPRFTLRVDSNQSVLKEPIRRLGASDLLTRWSTAEKQVSDLKRFDALDLDYYRPTAPECNAYGIDPYLHYVLYGELWNGDPSPVFSTTYYKLRRPDVVRAGVNVAAHYFMHGRREGSVGEPTSDNWLDLAESLNLFDVKWYQERYDVPSTMSCRQHYLLIGRPLQCATSANFDPSAIPVLQAGDHEDSLIAFLQTHYLCERTSYDELTRVTENNDFALIPELITDIVARFGPSAAPLSLLALTHVRTGDFAKAAEILERYWSEFESGKLCVRHRRSLIPENHTPSENFVEVSPRLRESSSTSVCVYTALFGNIDLLPPILTTSKYCRFFCFTDKIGHVDGWEYHIASPALGDPNLDAKLFKVFPDKFIEQFDYTIFVDANTLLLGRLDEFIEKYLVGNPFVMFSHPERNDVYAEGVAIVEAARHTPPKVLAQLSAYKDQGLPFEVGLLEASFIWRAYGDTAIRQLMESWWEHISRYSKRDQLSLAFLAWQRFLKPKTLPRDVGTSRENKYFFKLPHSKLPRDVSAETSTSQLHAWVNSTDIWFLYGSKFAGSGSTILRGEQLCQILKAADQENRGIFYSSFDAVSDKIVFLTKGYLAQSGLRGLRGLKERGNIILADFVDARPDPQMIQYIDVLIASSIKGFISYRQQFPAVRVHHITHHVDLRIQICSIPQTFVAGYFGELVNTIADEEIRRCVDFVSVNTSVVDVGWMQRLHDYSFHYAVRQRRGIDYHKPFLKGFVAAHCGANTVIQEDAGDAAYYLGEDYPYLLRSNASPEAIIECVQRAKDQFGGREWRYGLEVMAEIRERSSRETVAREFLQLLRTL